MPYYTHAHRAVDRRGTRTWKIAQFAEGRPDYGHTVLLAKPRQHKKARRVVEAALAGCRAGKTMAIPNYGRIHLTLCMHYLDILEF